MKIQEIEEIIIELAMAIRDLKEDACENSGQNWMDVFIKKLKSNSKGRHLNY